METYEMRVIMEVVTNTISVMPTRKKKAFHDLWESEYQPIFGVEIYWTNGYALRKSDGNYWLQEFFKVEDFKSYMEPKFYDLLKAIHECLIRVNKTLKMKQK